MPMLAITKSATSMGKAGPKGRCRYPPTNTQARVAARN